MRNNYAFENASNNERQALAKLFSAKPFCDFPVQFTASREFEHYDALMYDFSITDTGIILNRISLLEMKCREMSSGRFSDYILENGKYQNLLDAAEKVAKEYQCEVAVCYVNYFLDDTYLIWNLTKLKKHLQRWTSTMNLKRNTVVDNGSKNKLIYNLPTDQAWKITLS